ncbi:MAG: L-lysine 6-transaminase [Planctomycetota bacterium]|nr:MAG: L-lysine 6-transaminase [Planctomycetota bacterium]
MGGSGTVTTTIGAPYTVPAGEVHERLARYILADGMKLVLDYERSHGSWLVDKVTGREYLDFFSFFASQPIGFNHPALHEPNFERTLLKVARCKPSSSDIYTEEYAAFVETFARLGMREHFRYAFFIAGGALAVENCMKAAFDWKVRKNLAAGRGEIGDKVLHFTQAFHGRSGYTLTVTNTADPRKYMYFPRFDWPRVDAPALRFPRNAENDALTAQAERRAVAEIEAAFDQHPHEIAAILIEPIQGEGGDNHFRPEFLRELRRIADEREAMLIFDEVQTGGGITGTFWAWEQLGVRPDLLAFGKKLQVCGVLATERIDEVPDNVFHLPSRINSTWGGDVTDMVRSQRYLEVIESEGLLEHAGRMGERLLAGLEALCAEHEALDAPRGRGLMCAVDVESGERRDQIIRRAYELGVLALPCGVRSIRTRPFLDVRPEEIDLFCERIGQAVRETA